MNAEALAPLVMFRNMFYNFWVITWMNNVSNFQIGKIQPQDVA